jgi:hypothetical protein
MGSSKKTARNKPSLASSRKNEKKAGPTKKFPTGSNENALNHEGDTGTRNLYGIS